MSLRCVHRSAGFGSCSVHGRLIRTRYSAKYDAEAVPCIDRRNRKRESNQLVLFELPAHGVVHRVRNVAICYQSYRLGPFQRGALGFGEEGRFTPRVECVETLLGFASGASVPAVHIEQEAVSVKACRCDGTRSGECPMKLY